MDSVCSGGQPSCGTVSATGPEAGEAGLPDASTPPADARDDDAALEACGVVANCPSGGLPRPSQLGDVNGDGCVDQVDLRLVASCFGRPVGDPCGLSLLADFDGNGTVDAQDYRVIVRTAGQGCDAHP